MFIFPEMIANNYELPSKCFLNYHSLPGEIDEISTVNLFLFNLAKFLPS